MVYRKYGESLRKMKHINLVSGKALGVGNTIQNLICETAHVLNGIETAKGATSPILSFLDNKCDISVSS